MKIEDLLSLFSASYKSLQHACENYEKAVTSIDSCIEQESYIVEKILTECKNIIDRNLDCDFFINAAKEDNRFSSGIDCHNELQNMAIEKHTIRKNFQIIKDAIKKEEQAFNQVQLDKEVYDSIKQMVIEQFAKGAKSQQHLILNALQYLDEEYPSAIHEMILEKNVWRKQFGAFFRKLQNAYNIMHSQSEKIITQAPSLVKEIKILNSAIEEIKACYGYDADKLPKKEYLNLLKTQSPGIVNMYNEILRPLYKSRLTQFNLYNEIKEQESLETFITDLKSGKVKNVDLEK